LPFSHVVIYQALHTPRHNTVTNQLLAFTNLLLGCIRYFNILFKYSCMTLLEPHGMNKEQTSFTLINASKSCLSLVSSPGPKVHVNYCHHLASVVCKLFTFQPSSPKPLGRLEPNLAGMFLGWSSTKLLFFVPVGYSIWLPRSIICSDWLKFQRSSSLKLMN
jgi:hypothetical protein